MLFVRLCVIQFTRYIPFAHANFDILPRQLDFVKRFFQLFSKSFLARFPAGFAEVLAYTNRKIAICQALFYLFYDNFSRSTICGLFRDSSPKYALLFSSSHLILCISHKILIPASADPAASACDHAFCFSQVYFALMLVQTA